MPCITSHLMQEYKIFPANASITRISDGLDITPKTEDDIDYLNTLSLDDVIILVPPQDPITILVTVLVTTAVTLALTPKIPNATTRNIPESSPNNGLSARSNGVRIGARRPSILGQVNSFPDLLALPYKVFDDATGKEVEYNYMFVSEGTVTGAVFKDGATRGKHIRGFSAELYLPGNSPHVGSAHFVEGSPITEPFLSTRKSEAVNGQVLRPPNRVSATGNLSFIAPNIIRFNNVDDLTDKFEQGDILTVVNNSTTTSEPTSSYSRQGQVVNGKIRFETYANQIPIIIGNHVKILNPGYPNLSDVYQITSIQETVVPSRGGANNFTLGYQFTEFGVTPSPVTYRPETVTHHGQVDYTTSYDNLNILIGESANTFANSIYLIDSVTNSEIEVINPGSDWVNAPTAYTNREIFSEGERWTDYFILDDTQLEGVIVNLVASNGLFKDNGENQYAVKVDVTLGVTAVDGYDNPTGIETFHVVTLKGSSTIRDSVNKTLRAISSGRSRVRMSRSTPKDTGFDGQVVDEIKWRDLYSYKEIGSHDIDNTRVRASTVATEGALSVKERKLTLSDAIRHFPTKQPDGTMSSTLHPTKSAADILVAVSIDPLIGRRNINELDIDQIYATIEDINTYFQNETYSEFSYTLDSSDLSFEDTFSLISNAIFCRGYRRGLKLHLSLEKRQDDSTLIFNHINKEPGSEKRSIQFGVKNNYDGATCKWIDSDGIERTVSVPTSNLTNPEELSFLGLNQWQATKHGWRAWNKSKYQNVFTEFEALDEAALAVLGQRILVADNTLDDVYDGEVVSQDGLVLELTADVPETGWIHFQMPDDTLVNAVEYTRDSNKTITLNDPISVELSTDIENYARTPYLISDSNNAHNEAFLLLEKSGQGPYDLKLGIYDHRFYTNDADTVIIPDELSWNTDITVTEVIVGNTTELRYTWSPLIGASGSSNLTHWLVYEEYFHDDDGLGGYVTSGPDQIKTPATLSHTVIISNPKPDSYVKSWGLFVKPIFNPTLNNIPSGYSTVFNDNYSEPPSNNFWAPPFVYNTGDVSATVSPPSNGNRTVTVTVNSGGHRLSVDFTLVGVGGGYFYQTLATNRSTATFTRPVGDFPITLRPQIDLVQHNDALQQVNSNQFDAEDIILN